MTWVGFDFGQTLADLDCDFLVQRVAERGATVVADKIRENVPRAWDAYNCAKASGRVGKDAWSTFMRRLLELSEVHDSVGTPPEQLAKSLTEFLWSEQPRANLWRKPRPGMFDLVRDLRNHGTVVGIISNSEGHLAELVQCLGEGDQFSVVADSGRLGIEKPDPRIFQWTAEQLNQEVNEIVHIGDSWEADVAGALGVGGRAIWVSEEQRALPRGVLRAWSAREIREALYSFGVLT